MINVMDSGRHAWVTDFQEYMIIPTSAVTFADAVRMKCGSFSCVGKITDRDLSYDGWRWRWLRSSCQNGNMGAYLLLSRAIEQAGYKLGVDFGLRWTLRRASFTRTAITWRLNTRICRPMKWFTYKALLEHVPVRSIEDDWMKAWEDWENDGWFGQFAQLVGDDLLVTVSSAELMKGWQCDVIKPNKLAHWLNDSGCFDGEECWLEYGDEPPIWRDGGDVTVAGGWFGHRSSKTGSIMRAQANC